MTPKSSRGRLGHPELGIVHSRAGKENRTRVGGAGK